MKMPYLLLAVLSGLLIHSPATAQVPDTPIGQSIVGTWISDMPDAAGNPITFEIGTFSPDGSYIGANVNGLQSTHMGVWQRTGHREFALTVEFARQDVQGAFVGLVRVQIAITLSEDLNSYDAVGVRSILDRSGNLISAIPGIKGHAHRMELLPLPE